MSSIEARVATGLGDQHRPIQRVDDGRAQVQASDQRKADVPAPGALDTGAVAADDIHAISERLQQVVEVASGRQLNFGINDATSSLFLEISERGSGEVIKQIPAEGVLELASRLDDLVGLLLDEQA